MAGSSHVTNPVYSSSSKACQLNVIKTDFSPLIFLHSSKQTSKSNTSTNYSYQTSKLLTLPQTSKCLQTTENNSLSTAATVPTRGKLLSSLKSLTSNTILFTMTRRLVTLPPPKKKTPLVSVLVLTFNSVAQKEPAFTALNPNGRFPALIDHSNNDFVIWESGAIILYLVGKYDKEHKISFADYNQTATANQYLMFQMSGWSPQNAPFSLSISGNSDVGVLHF